MGIIKKVVENGKKVIKVGVKLMPKGKVGEVVKEEEEPKEEMEEGPEVEEEKIEEEGRGAEKLKEFNKIMDKVDEERKEEVADVPEKEINYIVGEIVPYAKELGYVVTDSDGTPIECKDKAEAILVAKAVKDEKTTTAS